MLEDVFPKALPYTLAANDQIYFLHIAKTAGRSFEDFLKSQFSPAQTIRINTDQGYPEQAAVAAVGHYRLYLGHLGHHFLSYFPAEKKPFWVTMLRDPVERVLSYYYFFRNAQPVNEDHRAYKFQALASQLSLRAFVEHELSAELIQNYQFNNLVDSEMLYYAPDRITLPRDAYTSDELVSLVKNRLEHECLFFGITEQYERSIALLCYLLNWDMPTQPLTKLNVTPRKPNDADIDPETIAAIRARVVLDTEIYNFARGLFERRFDAMVNHLLMERPTIQPKQWVVVLVQAIPQKMLNPAPSREAILQEASLNALKNSRFMNRALRFWYRFQRTELGIKRRLGLFRTPVQFDAAFYLQQWSDVAGAQIDPYMHYKLWGWKEGRNPNPYFDGAGYLANHPEALKSGVDPLEHAIKHHLYHQYEEGVQREPLAPITTWQLEDANATRLPRLCFHIPASPNDSFFSQIAMFRMALDRLGGLYEQADIVITFGHDEILPLPQRWQPYLSKHIKLNWADPAAFQQHSYDAQGDARWLYDHDEYDVVCFLDADVIILKPIDDLLINLLQNPSVMGAIAGYTMPSTQGKNPHEVWRDLSQRFIGQSPTFDYRHMLVEAQADELTFCPFYVNFGVLLLTPQIIRTMRDTHLSLRPKIAPELEFPYFSAQVSFALAIAAHNIPRQALSLRYNFYNDEVADRLHPNDLQDVRLIHYLRTEFFDRQKIFTSRFEFEHFLTLELSGSNKIFQDYIRDLTGGIYPFD